MDVQTAAGVPQLVNAFGTYILEEGTRAADLADPLEAMGFDVSIGPRPFGALAFDIGAHVGGRTASFLRLGASVVALEQQPRLFRALRLIHGRGPRATLRPHAVGRQAGTATLHLNPRISTVATLAPAFTMFASAVSTLSMAASPYSARSRQAGGIRDALPHLANVGMGTAISPRGLLMRRSSDGGIDHGHRPDGIDGDP